MSGTITLLIILLATLSTAFLSSIFGMLGGLILMGALITIMPVSQAMVLHGLIQLTSNGYRAWLNKTDIKWNIVSTLIIGNTISLVGLFSLAFVPDKITVLLVLGLLPYIAWALPKNNSLDVSKKPKMSHRSANVKALFQILYLWLQLHVIDIFRDDSAKVKVNY